MTINYDKLWKLLIDKKMNRTDLKNVAGVSFNVLAKMSRNEFVSLEIFCKNRQNLVKQRITPHFLTTDHPNYYEFTTKG